MAIQLLYYIYTIQLYHFRKQHEIWLSFLVQGATWDNFQYLEDLMGYPSWRVDVLEFRSRSKLDCLSWHFEDRFMFQIAELCPWDGLNLFCLISEMPKLWLLYRPSSSSPHMLPSSSTKTCWSGCSVSMAQQNVHRKAKMESDEKVGQSLFSLHSRPNKWEKQSKHEVKTLKFYVNDMNMTRQHMATLVLEFMCCQCSAWLWDLVFSTLEVAASHVAHLMSWRQLHSDQTRKWQTE